MCIINNNGCCCWIPAKCYVMLQLNIQYIEHRSLVNIFAIFTVSFQHWFVLKPQMFILCSKLSEKIVSLLQHKYCIWFDLKVTLDNTLNTIPFSWLSQLYTIHTHSYIIYRACTVYIQIQKINSFLKKRWQWLLLYRCHKALHDHVIYVMQQLEPLDEHRPAKLLKSTERMLLVVLKSLTKRTFSNAALHYGTIFHTV